MLNKEGTDGGCQAVMKSEIFRRNAMAFYRQHQNLFGIK